MTPGFKLFTTIFGYDLPRSENPANNSKAKKILINHIISYAISDNMDIQVFSSKDKASIVVNGELVSMKSQ